MAADELAHLGESGSLVERVLESGEAVQRLQPAEGGQRDVDDDGAVAASALSDVTPWASSMANSHPSAARTSRSRINTSRSLTRLLS